MKRIQFAMGTILSAAALTASAPAVAQVDDLDPAAVTAASRYALPMVFEGYLSRCNTALSPSGYALSNSSRLNAKFSEGSDAAWPAAKAAMLELMAEDAGDMSEMLGMLGDESLRPMVDALIAGMVSQELKTENCESIERGLEILDPLPAENLAELIGFFIEMEQKNDAADDGEARR